MAESILDTKGLVDFHCHLNTKQFNEGREQIVSAAAQNGVEMIVDVGIDITSAQNALANSQRYEIVKPTVGIHPEILVPGSDLYDPKYDEVHIETLIKQMRELLDENPGTFVMIGECGLDYYWLHQKVEDKDQQDRIKQLQRVLFKSQVEVAIDYELPLTIHARDAHEDTMRILVDHAGQVDAVMHSFTGSFVELMQIIEHGYYIGLNGIITFKSATSLQEAVKTYLKGKAIESPEDLYKHKIVLETDSPYLAPVPHRGKTNQPAYVNDVFEFIKTNLVS